MSLENFLSKKSRVLDSLGVFHTCLWHANGRQWTYHLHHQSNPITFGRLENLRAAQPLRDHKWKHWNCLCYVTWANGKPCFKWKRIYKLLETCKTWGKIRKRTKCCKHWKIVCVSWRTWNMQTSELLYNNTNDHLICLLYLKHVICFTNFIKGFFWHKKVHNRSFWIHYLAVLIEMIMKPLWLKLQLPPTARTKRQNSPSNFGSSECSQPRTTPRWYYHVCYELTRNKRTGCLHSAFVGHVHWLSSRTFHRTQWWSSPGGQRIGEASKSSCCLWHCLKFAIAWCLQFPIYVHTILMSVYHGILIWDKYIYIHTSITNVSVPVCLACEKHQTVKPFHCQSHIFPPHLRPSVTHQSLKSEIKAFIMR